MLVGKIELWYVSDIASVVKCCLCLHNMMVAFRMSQDEEESEEFYAFPGLARSDDTEEGGHHADEAEQVYVDRRVAEMRLHAELYGTNNQQDHTMTDHECQILQSLRYQYVQRRWECLYDVTHEHLRLRDSIMKHIEM